jgi:hypothetical protein
MPWPRGRFACAPDSTDGCAVLVCAIPTASARRGAEWSEGAPARQRNEGDASECDGPAVVRRVCECVCREREGESVDAPDVRIFLRGALDRGSVQRKLFQLQLPNWPRPAGKSTLAQPISPSHSPGNI